MCCQRSYDGALRILEAISNLFGLDEWPFNNSKIFLRDFFALEDIDGRLLLLSSQVDDHVRRGLIFK